MYIGGYYIIPQSLSDAVAQLSASFEYVGAFELFRMIADISKTKQVLINIGLIVPEQELYSTVPVTVMVTNDDIRIIFNMALGVQQLTVSKNVPNTVLRQES